MYKKVSSKQQAVLLRRLVKQKMRTSTVLAGGVQVLKDLFQSK